MKVSAQASHGTCSIRQGKKVTGQAYGRLSADFSAHQQDTSAIVQIAGTPWGRWGGIWGILGSDPGNLLGWPAVPSSSGRGRAMRGYDRQISQRLGGFCLWASLA